MSRLRLVLIGLAVVGSLVLAGIALAGEFTGFPKLSPLYPPPPYLMTEISYIRIVFEADEAAIRELLPPGVEPVPEHTAGIGMYVSARRGLAFPLTVPPTSMWTWKASILPVALKAAGWSTGSTARIG